MIPKHAQQLLDEIDNLNYKPNSQEKDLIRSVKRAIGWNKLLSRMQANWLQDIYAKASGGSDHQPRHYV